MECKGIRFSMVKTALIAAILLQIVVSLISEGLAKSLAELSAFIITIALAFFHHQQSKHSSDKADSNSV